MEKLTLEQAVELYGTEKQKEAIITNKGNLKVKMFDALIKTLNQHYETVEVEGRGKKRIITLEGRFEEMQERERKEGTGQGQIPYENEMYTLFLDALIKNKKTDEFLSMGLNSWLIHLKLISKHLKDARYDAMRMYFHLDVLSKEFMGEFSSKDIPLLREFVTTETSTLKRQLKNAMLKFHEKKIIILQIQLCGGWSEKDADGNHVERFRKLDDAEITRYSNICEEVFRESGLTKTQEIGMYSIPNTELREKQNKYRKLLKERLEEELAVEYVYEAYGCRLFKPTVVAENTVKNLLEKGQGIPVNGLTKEDAQNVLCQYRGTFSEYCTDRAEKRQGKPSESELKALNKEKKHMLDLKVSGDYAKKWELLLKFYNLVEEYNSRYSALVNDKKYKEYYEGDKGIEVAMMGLI